MLDAHDPDFAELFKVLADFETSSACNQRGVRSYAGFLAHLARHEGLPSFARDAVVALTEQGGTHCGPARSTANTRPTSLAPSTRKAFTF